MRPQKTSRNATICGCDAVVRPTAGLSNHGRDVHFGPLDKRDCDQVVKELGVLPVLLDEKKRPGTTFGSLPQDLRRGGAPITGAKGMVRAGIIPSAVH